MNTKQLLVLAATCSATLGIVGVARAAIAPKGLTDAEVLGIYIQVNGFDIETALLGRAQASASSVRDMAKQVSSDHQAVRATAYDLARTCKVTPALPAARTEAAVDHVHTMTTL